MNISSDYYSSSQNYAESLFSNNDKNLNEALSAATKPQNNKSPQEADKSQDVDNEGYRETYGLDTLAKMSDEEYSAFVRATANMSPNEKIQAAQSLHLVAKSFEEAQKMLQGGGLVGAMSGNTSDTGYFKSNPDMLDKGISVLKEMSSGEGRSMASFLTRYKGALAGGGLNISA